MRRIFIWATVASGAIAAYMMFRRGAPLSEIARKAVVNPIGSMVSEFKQAG